MSYVSAATRTRNEATDGSNKQPQNSLLYLRPQVAELKLRLDAFVTEECIPAEAECDAHLAARHGSDRWTLDAVPPCLAVLQQRAQSLGLWNLFIPPHLIHKVPSEDPEFSVRFAPKLSLSYREYGILCESLGRSPHIAPVVTNTNAPDTGNMEVLLEFGTPWQRNQYLVPLLRGDIRSAFLMTEPNVASSDPTNLETKLTKKIVGNRVEYVLTGQKWWSTGAMDPRCRVALVVAKMDYSHPSLQSVDAQQRNGDISVSSPKHGAHTIVAVPLPHPGVVFQRALTLFGYDDAPHGHAQVGLTEVRLLPQDLILGEGSGFRVSQARLGPGRIHHCMRAIGMGMFNRYLWNVWDCTSGPLTSFVCFHVLLLHLSSINGITHCAHLLIFIVW